MFTDWMIVRRLALELERALRGRRIDAAGRMADGRFGVRTADIVLAIDAFGATPLILLESDASIEPQAGWARTISDALRGLRIDAVRARPRDRLIALDASARSRFGVGSGYRLAAELVPRFGNIVLLKDDTVVAAAKEFPRTPGSRRSTLAGEPYEPPPLPGDAGGGVPATEACTELQAAFEAIAAHDAAAERERAVRALRRAQPLVPQLVAGSIVAETVAFAGSSETLAARSLKEAQRIVAAASDGAYDATEVFAYRDGPRLIQPHVVPLAQFFAFAGARETAYAESREAALLPLLHESVDRSREARDEAAFEARRASLRARLEKRQAALGTKRALLERERDDASQRDALRLAGELLYAHLGDVPPGATAFVPSSDPRVTIELDPQLDAKANAAAIFKRYRKAAAKLTHVERRLVALAEQERFTAELRWELDRAEPQTLDDVARTIAPRGRRESGRSPAARRQPPIEVSIAPDARAYVGRSPHGNADVTFRIARPEDLWFHARGAPGAHVVLHIDSQRAPTDAEVLLSAALAAQHSRASESEKVSVDYTQRKFVRRQRDAPPGLVWYTHARSLVVAPHRPAGAER